MFALLTQYKTYVAGAGLMGLALYQLTQGEYQAATAALLAGLGAVGLRHETAPRLVPTPPPVGFAPAAGYDPGPYESYNK